MSLTQPPHPTRPPVPRSENPPRTSRFARPLDMNWLQVALRLGENDACHEDSLDALAPFTLPRRKHL